MTFYRNWKKCNSINITKAAVVHGGSVKPLVESRGDTLYASTILKYWKPKNMILDCYILGDYPKISNCRFKRYDERSLNRGEFFYLKNGLIYPNKKTEKNPLYFFKSELKNCFAPFTYSRCYINKIYMIIHSWELSWLFAKCIALHTKQCFKWLHE